MATHFSFMAICVNLGVELSVAHGLQDLLSQAGLVFWKHGSKKQ